MKRQWKLKPDQGERPETSPDFSYKKLVPVFEPELVKGVSSNKCNSGEVGKRQWKLVEVFIYLSTASVA